MKKKLLMGIVAAVLLLWRVTSIVQSLQSFITTLEPIYRHPFASYDEKMAMKYPQYYYFIKSVRKLTPGNSTIILPAKDIAFGQDMWPITNLPMTMALLFPRNIIISGNLQEMNNSPTYLVVLDDYPKVVIKAKETILFKNSDYLEIYGDYHPDSAVNYRLGLIKL